MTPRFGMLFTMILISSNLVFASYSEESINKFRSKDEIQISQLRDQEINQLRITLGRRGSSNRSAELYLRLAEIYLEAYRATFLLEGRYHEELLAQGKTQGTIDRENSKKYLKLGIKACQDVLRLKINFERLDQVYYMLGFNYDELGDLKSSAQYFQSLVQKYPNSTYAPEAHREIGDHYYRQNSFKKAQESFEKALKYKKELKDHYPRVLHRLAWTQYKQKSFSSAVETMKIAVQSSFDSGEKLIGLKDEALKDLAVFMTETGKTSEALEYFRKVVSDESFYPKILERMAKQYERNVEPAKAVQIYEAILKTSSDDEIKFRTVVKLVDLDLRRQKYKEVADRLRSSKIVRDGEGDTKLAYSNLKAMVRRTATENHENFRKSGVRTNLEVCDLFYSLYIDLFLKHDDSRKETPEIKMYLAEVKRELGQAKQASDLYRQIIDLGDVRFAKEAGALWTASLAEAIKKAAKQSGKTKDPSPLEQEFVEAADELQDSLGDTPEGREALLKAAQVLAGYSSTHSQSIKRIKKLINKNPKTPQALLAARLWIQIYSDQLPKVTTQDFEKSDVAGELKDVLEDLRESKQLIEADQEFGNRKLISVIQDQEARFKVGAIAKQEQEKDFESAAKGYEQFAQDSKAQDLAEKSYGSAVSSFAKASLYDQSERVIGVWQKRYPKSKSSIESIRALATLALIQGQFEIAAKLFERLALSSFEPAALETAARIFEGNAQAEQARRVLLMIGTHFSKSASVAQSLLKLAKSYELEQRTEDSVKKYKECLSTPAALGGSVLEAECSVRLAEVYIRLQEKDQARLLLKRAAGLKGSSASPYVGYARFKLAELVEQEAKFEPLTLPEDQLKKALTQRLNFVEPLSQAYLSAVEAQGPWAIAALDRLASWAYQFALDVDRIGTGQPGLQKSLAEISGPLKKKAWDTWERAYQTALKDEVLSQALPKTVDELASARRPGYFFAQGSNYGYRISGVAADGGNEGRQTAMERVREKLSRTPTEASLWVDYGNLLWGLGKPILSRLAYERALTLDKNSVSARINQAVVILSSEGGVDDWLNAARAYELLQKSLELDDLSYIAKFNSATLLNYYRLFQKSKNLWDKVLARSQSIEALDGQAVSLTGLGNYSNAELAFKKADKDLDTDRFTRGYHQASQYFFQSNYKKCASLASDVESTSKKGFEKESAERLVKYCQKLKETTK